MIQRMITTRIKEVAEKRGITTAYQLQKVTGLPPSMAARLFRDEVDMIALRTLDRLCTVFKCKPNDLLKHEPSSDE